MPRPKWFCWKIYAPPNIFNFKGLSDTPKQCLNIIFARLQNWIKKLSWSILLENHTQSPTLLLHMPQMALVKNLHPPPQQFSPSPGQ